MTKKIEDEIKTILKDFSDKGPEVAGASDSHLYPNPREDFPYPELLLICLRDIMGFNASKFEKIRWTITCYFQGQEITFLHRKMGFVIRHSIKEEEDVQRAISILKRAVKNAGELLNKISRKPIQEGRVTITNQRNFLIGRYKFFRDSAESKYLEYDDFDMLDHSRNSFHGGCLALLHEYIFE